MNEQTCIICFDQLPDNKLACCNKLVHEKCVREWWSKSELSNCPHCRQKANLVDNIITVENCYFGKEETNICIELSDDRIIEINENTNNIIPNNMFINEDTNYIGNNLIQTILLIFFTIFIISLIIIVYIF